eukprot:gene12291-13556_t
MWMKLFVVFFGLAVPNKCSGEKIKDAKKCTEYPCLIFEDNFDSLDFDTWQHAVSMMSLGHNEFQVYVNNRSNSFVRDGALYLKPTLTSDTYGEDFLKSGTLDLWGERCTCNRGNVGCYRKGTPEQIINPVTSAKVRTLKSFSFKYGRLKVRAKLPKGDWLWPAIWLQPSKEVYGDWPASGEIDLVEARGNNNLRNGAGQHVGNKMASSTLHWGPYNAANKFPHTQGVANMEEGSFADDYHDYTMDWTAHGMHFYVDDKTILKFRVPKQGFWKIGNFEESHPGSHNPWVNGAKMAPFDQEFYVIMNVAVGGNTFFFDSFQPKKPWGKNDTLAMSEFWKAKDEWYGTWKGDDTAMKVDFVKVWKLQSDESQSDKVPQGEEGDQPEAEALPDKK